MKNHKKFQKKANKTFQRQIEDATAVTAFLERLHFSLLLFTFYIIFTFKFLLSTTGEAEVLERQKMEDDTE